MVTRSREATSLERMKQWQEKNLCDINTVSQSLEYCFRLAKRGKSSGIVIPLQNSFEIADKVLANLQYRDLDVDEYSGGELRFTNGAVIKIFTQDKKTMVKHLLGMDAAVVMAGQGDPCEDRAQKILDF